MLIILPSWILGYRAREGWRGEGFKGANRAAVPTARKRRVPLSGIKGGCRQSLNLYIPLEKQTMACGRARAPLNTSTPPIVHDPLQKIRNTLRITLSETPFLEVKTSTFFVARRPATKKKPFLPWRYFFPWR